MTTSDSDANLALTSGEREYIRSELDTFFSTLLTAVDGFQLQDLAGRPAEGPAEAAAGGQKLG